jgi:hypothetical protein
MNNLQPQAQDEYSHYEIGLMPYSDQKDMINDMEHRLQLR